MESSPHPFQAMVSGLEPAGASETPPSADSDGGRPEAPSHVKFIEQPNARPASISLSGIDRPALLINFDLEIAWQNKGAIEHIWQNASKANNGNPTPNILDVIFDPSYKRKVANFSTCLSFYMGHMLELLSKEEITDRIAHMADRHQSIILGILENKPEHSSGDAKIGRYFHPKLRSGSRLSFSVAAVNCREGRLLIFEPLVDTDRPDISSGHTVTDRFDQIRRQPNPLETPYFLLAAQINKASMLKTEMLADEHWRLISALYRRCLNRVESYGGIFGRNIENGFVAYFLPDQNLEIDAMQVVECALGIKAEALELGRKWKISKNWQREIDLNIGLHHEEAYIGTLPVSSGEILTSFGQGMEIVNAIAHMAREGQIWATKPVIHRISKDGCKALRFGIMHSGKQEQQAFIRNGFAAMRDVFDLLKSGDSIDPALSYLPITQIYDFSGMKK